jgi:hypothetical protein
VADADGVCGRDRFAVVGDEPRAHMHIADAVMDLRIDAIASNTGETFERVAEVIVHSDLSSSRGVWKTNTFE